MSDKHHPAVRAYLRQRAAIAGKAGKGASKRRGDAAYYRLLAKMAKRGAR